MEGPPPTRTLDPVPQLHRLRCLSPQNHELVQAYLVHLRARHYASSTQDNALRALKCFTVLLPTVRQATLYQDLTQTTPADIDAWIAAAVQQGLAPGTIVTCRRGLQGFFSPYPDLSWTWPPYVSLRKRIVRGRSRLFTPLRPALPGRTELPILRLRPRRK